MLQYISIKDISSSDDEYPRYVSLLFADGKIVLLGNLKHNAELGIDKENGEKLIELIRKCIN